MMDGENGKFKNCLRYNSLPMSHGDVGHFLSLDQAAPPKPTPATGLQY